MPSAWELGLGTARFTLTLSPERYRGFSGEGAVLGALADDSVTADAELIRVLLAWSPRIDIRGLSAAAGFSAERTMVALTQLAASGHVGYDHAEQAFFRRELPFGPAMEKLHPRLADARALIASGAVLPHGGGASVRSGDAEHRVTFAKPHDICTCPWWGKYRGTRGPCKHVLAARMAARTDESVRIAAADVWAQAALAGRLDQSLAAEALVTGITDGAFKLTRVADGLRHAAHEPASADLIAQTVFASADHLTAAKSPNLHPLLKLTGEIGTAIALPEPPEGIVTLAAGKGSTKLAIAARRLVRR